MGFTAIVIPTRGFVFSKVLEAVERERQGKDTRLYVSCDLPIPDSHNELTRKALLDGAEYLWIIEEDTVPPPGSFESIAAHGDVACLDYGVSGWSCITKNPQGEILWCGLGCTMVHRRVFEALEYPYFRTDKTLRLNDWKWIDNPKKGVYGGLDIWFCCKAREKGFKIVQVEGECEHLQLDSLGQREINYGLHKISRKPKISKIQTITEIIK